MKKSSKEQMRNASINDVAAAPRSVRYMIDSKGRGPLDIRDYMTGRAEDEKRCPKVRGIEKETKMRNIYIAVLLLGCILWFGCEKPEEPETGPLLDNPGFSSSLSPWTQTITEGDNTVEWSSDYGGSAKIWVSGSPGRADISQPIKRTLKSGEEVIIYAHHTDQYPIACWELYLGSELVWDHGWQNHSGEQDDEIHWTATKDYPQGTLFTIQVNVWPGEVTMWFKDIQVK